MHPESYKINKLRILYFVTDNLWFEILNFFEEFIPCGTRCLIISSFSPLSSEQALFHVVEPHQSMHFVVRQNFVDQF